MVVVDPTRASTPRSPSLHDRGSLSRRTAHHHRTERTG